MIYDIWIRLLRLRDRNRSRSRPRRNVEYRFGIAERVERLETRTVLSFISVGGATGNVLQYTAVATEVNNVSITQAAAGTITITDSGATIIVIGSTTDFTQLGNSSVRFNRLPGSITVDLLDGNDLNTTVGLIIPLAIFGGSGDDTIGGGNASDIVDGGDGNDVLFDLRAVVSGLTGDDSITGGLGNDIINATIGNDTLDGGDGNDLYAITFNAAAAIAETATFLDSGGTDALRFASASNTFGITVDLSNNVGVGIPGDAGYPRPPQFVDGLPAATSLHRIFIGSSDLAIPVDIPAVFETLIGTPQNDRLIGNSANNVLDGRDGSDTLIDSLGNDVLMGGNGNDTYIVTPGGVDILREQTPDPTDATEPTRIDPTTARLIGATGVDTIDFSSSTRGISLNLSITGAAQIIDGFSSLTLNVGVIPPLTTPLSDFDNIIGTNLNDNLTGNQNPAAAPFLLNGGQNSLVGGNGNDTLSGLNGIDTLLGGNGNDTLSDLLPAPPPQLNTLDGGPDCDLINNVPEDECRVRFNRMYNAAANFHFFTSSQSEFNILRGNPGSGYRDETTGRIGFVVLNFNFGTPLTPLFRLYNSTIGYHYYTTNLSERNYLVGLGWRYERDEGFIFTRPPTPIDPTLGATPVEIFRMYNRNSGTHLLTHDPAVKTAVLLLPGWELHASLGFAYAELVPAPARRASAVSMTGLLESLSPGTEDVAQGVVTRTFASDTATTGSVAQSLAGRLDPRLVPVVSQRPLTATGIASQPASPAETSSAAIRDGRFSDSLVDDLWESFGNSLASPKADDLFQN